MLEPETCVSSKMRRDTRLMTACASKGSSCSRTIKAKVLFHELDGQEGQGVIWVMGLTVETRTKPCVLNRSHDRPSSFRCLSRSSLRCNDALIPCIPLVNIIRNALSGTHCHSGQKITAASSFTHLEKVKRQNDLTVSRAGRVSLCKISYLLYLQQSFIQMYHRKISEMKDRRIISKW
jgi:hypothetical protein